MNELIRVLNGQFNSLRIKSFLQKGYSDVEIGKIENLYGFKIKDNIQLYEFLNTIGRCSGGFFGSSPLIFYSDLSIRMHVVFQGHINYEMLSAEKEIECKEDSFIISVENNNEYYFLYYKDGLVYCFNKKEDRVESTGKTFNEYLLSVIERYSISADPDSLYATGELIIV
ncbi:hypothetical protein VQ643_15005 [Pseudomonas sp. F1_0610]|uniref:hypothetical protein n=1 Tax=Pseudomonas sp. F1_0610 TaxID=3114284 RepID=UPI0039C220A1